MAPVDAITPPAAKRKKVAPSRGPGQPAAAPPPAVPTQTPVRAALPTQSPVAQPAVNPRRLRWILAGATTAIVFIGWAVLLQSGALTHTKGSPAWQQITKQASELWGNFKTKILKIKPTKQLQDATTDEERIQILEKEVFPNLEKLNQ
ncbi:MAG: hypothetical protein V1916_00230 [Patescibacteria group bacterium]